MKNNAQIKCDKNTRLLLFSIYIVNIVISGGTMLYRGQR